MTTTTDLVKRHLRHCDLSRDRDYTCAAAIGVCDSTMYIRLREEGTSYRRMKLAERKRRCDALIRSGSSVNRETIADAVGYVQIESARRSFKNWYGETITQYNRGLL